MASGSDADVDWPHCIFEVADEGGEVVFELPFSEAVQGTDSPSQH